MMQEIIFFVTPFIMVFPATVAFVKWRETSFNNRQLAAEFLVFFAFFLFNFFFVYRFSHTFASYRYIFKIIDPFFFLFLVQKDISYSIKGKKLTKLLILILVNVFLQIFDTFGQNFYGHELLSLCVLLFSVYVAICIGREYYLAVYVLKMSRYLLIVLAIPYLLFDSHIFRFLFVAVVFYVSFEKRHLELSDSQAITKKLLAEQARFKDMMKEISDSIKDFSNKEDAANSYLNSLCNLLSARGAAIYEWNNDKSYFSCIAVSGLYFPLDLCSEKLFTRADLLREMAFKQRIKDNKSIIWKCGFSNGSGILLSHSSDDMNVMNFILGNLSHEVRSIILIPLLQESELLGVLVLENKIEGDYLTETDFNMARNFTSFATIILNTSRIITQKNENLRMSMELISGNVIQTSLFSHTVPQVAGIDISFFMQPAKEMGGDYYDFIEKDAKLAVVIGDVSGKGVSAGVLVAIMQTYLQNQYRKEDDLKKLIVGLNNYLSSRVDTGMFVTLLLFEWDSSLNRLNYVSCGHEHILHYHSKDKNIECIRSGGLALMMDSDIEPYIKICELVVEEGDSIILYTDGVTETFNPAKEFFGLEKLVKFFESAPINKRAIENLLPQTLADWRGDANQADDITCVLMQF